MQKRSKGIAYVDFDSAEAADKAIAIVSKLAASRNEKLAIAMVSKLIPCR